MPKKFIAKLDARICDMNRRRADTPLTRSTFIVAAIIEKLNKMERSKGSGFQWTVNDDGLIEEHTQPVLEMS